MGVTLFGDQSPANPVSQATGYPYLSSGVAAGTAADEALADSPTAEALRTADLQSSALGPIIAGGRGGVLRGPSESPLLQPDEANQQYGIKGTLSWDKPVRAATAKLQNQFATERLQRADVLSRATSGVLPTTARLAASLGASALDPLNIAASFVPVVGEARFARLGLVGARIARGAVEGAAGQALIEPIALQNASAEDRDYGMWDSLSNIAMGAGLGAILHTGGGFLHDRLFGVPEFTPPQDHATALSGAIAALSEDRPIRVAEYLRAMEASRRSDLLNTTALTSEAPQVPLEASLQEFGPLNQEAARPGQSVSVDLPTPGEAGGPAVYPADTLGFGSEIRRLQDQAAREGRTLALRRSTDETRLVEPAEFEVVDQFPDELTARANINRMPPAEREGLQTIPFTRADGNQGTVVVRGLSDGQAAVLRQQPELVDQALARGAGESAVTDLPQAADTTGTRFQSAWQDAMRSQRQSHEVQPDQAGALAEWNREAAGYDRSVASVPDSSEAESYAAATDEILQATREQGLLRPEHEAVLAAEDENIRSAEARGRGFAQAAACIARAL
jgi:hypothetical protein